MAAPPSSQLQNMLQSAVQSVQWTYSLFWQVCPQQGILIWGDGYYNGAIKTRKTVQPMEVSTEEASLQRSQQLRELYDSLMAEEANQPARRPSAALLPEDLTESEWFYLMSVSFSFPPGVGLPGKAYARQQHVWLTGANEANSKVFSRAILAKSAGVQTVLCIPIIDGVVELGTTERVQEDHGLIQHIKSFFMDYQPKHKPNPAQSEQSTSDPSATSDGPHFRSRPLLSIYSAVDPPADTNQEDEEEEEEEDEEEEAESDDPDTETGRNTHQSAPQDPLQLRDPIIHALEMAQAAAEPSELIQFEMSEDIRLGSPDDGSNNLGPDKLTLAESPKRNQVDTQRQTETTSRWPLLQNPLLQLQASETSQPQVEEELTPENTHYSQTVSMILEHSSVHWPESSPVKYIGYSSQSAFSKWNRRNNNLLRIPSDGTSQWLLKYILFSLPFLYNKYRDENSPKSRYADTTSMPLRKIASQDELSANHVLAERRRREKLNERFIILRSLVPFVTKTDKASILGDTIEYVKQLKGKIKDLEIRNQKINTDQRSKNGDVLKSGVAKEHGNSGGGTVQERRKLRIVEKSDGGRTKVVEGVPIVGNVVEVSIIECDALIELKCLYREGLLLDIMQTLQDLLIEITAIRSSSTDGIFVAELRAKVKLNSNGKKVTIAEVKRAIHHIISHY